MSLTSDFKQMRHTVKMREKKQQVMLGKTERIGAYKKITLRFLDCRKEK